MQQSIAFLPDRHGKSIAYVAMGRGRPLICDAGPVSHLQIQWEYLPYRRFIEALAQSHRVIRYDPPGIGLGDATGAVVTFQDNVAVLEDLIAGLSLESVDLFGASQAAPVTIAYAARWPERVGKLVIFGGFAYGPGLTGDELKKAFQQLMRANWGMASKAFSDIFIPGADEPLRAWFVRWVRASATAEAGARRLSMMYATNIRDLLARVQTPTLVMHRQGDRAVRFELGRELAAGIPGARFLPMEGRAHFWYVGDLESVLTATLEFLGDRRRAPKAESHLSRREREVAALIERGLSNGEIASRLGISERTAEAHAEHIRNKLGFHSRSQIAAWAAENLAE